MYDVNGLYSVCIHSNALVLSLHVIAPGQPPQNVAVHNVTVHNLLVTFDPSPEPNGVVTRYDVNVKVSHTESPMVLMKILQNITYTTQKQKATVNGYFM